MITVGKVIKNELIKRNMTQTDLLRKMQKMNFSGVNRCHISNIINNTDSRPQYLLLRKIEIVLNLPEFTLINIAGSPNKAKIKQLKEIKANE